MVCVRCGNPKDESEEYEMPADPSAVASVEEPELLRLANAGENWRCQYCSSNQRASDGSCANCGAGKPVPQQAAAFPAAPRPAARARSGAGPKRALIAIALTIASTVMMGAVVGGGLFCWRAQRPWSAAHAAELRFVEGKVTSVHWEHTVSVQRWQPVDHEGFAESRPADAEAVQAKEQRVHHHEQVLDGYDTEYYEVREQDGTTRESYTERVSCGQDCTSTPRTCRQVCTNKKNGFASCRDECSGGGQKCTTKYCSETRYKEVPRYKNVRKSRQKPRYRSEPRMATWYAWKSWEWVENRRVPKQGDHGETAWPSEAEVALSADGKTKERAERMGTYEVRISYAGAQELIHRPGNEQEFARFPLGSAQCLRQNGRGMALFGGGGE